MSPVYTDPSMVDPFSIMPDLPAIQRAHAAAVGQYAPFQLTGGVQLPSFPPGEQEPLPQSGQELGPGQELVIMEAGWGALLPLAARGLSALARSRWLAGLLTGGAGVALLGNGGGNGAEVALRNGAAINGVPVGGPGMPEPSKFMIAKEWTIRMDSKEGDFNMHFFRLIDGRVMSHNTRTKIWKIWRPKKHIVISANPRVKTLGKLARLNKRVEKMLRPYQPRQPRVKLVPSGALSAIERKALR